MAPLKLQRDSRRELLDAAARLFRTQGYVATSLRDIASAVGIKAGSIYYHFTSKDEIVIEVLNTGVLAVSDAVRKSIEALDSSSPASVLIETAIDAHMRTLLELDDYTSANFRIFGQVPHHVRRATLATRRTYEAYWARLLDRCAACSDMNSNVDLRLVSLFLFGAMNGSLEWYRPDGRYSVRHLARALMRIFLCGVGRAEKQLLRTPRTQPRRPRAKRIP